VPCECGVALLIRLVTEQHDLVRVRVRVRVRARGLGVRGLGVRG
jgi:hypothetical protein